MPRCTCGTRQTDISSGSTGCLHYAAVPSPIGKLLVISEDDRLREIRFGDGVPEPGWVEGGRTVDEATRQLVEYLAGGRTGFDLVLDPAGTAFQRRVWEELRRIPYGTTISYAELARRIGSPKAVRAVGAANGKNPLPIVIPCHRVIGKDGSLTGFGGGLDVKRWLLALEAADGVRPLPMEWESRPPVDRGR
jgi:methylated-DNA-[protein]-cysteine S-methyltransferase